MLPLIYFAQLPSGLIKIGATNYLKTHLADLRHDYGVKLHCWPRCRVLARRNSRFTVASRIFKSASPTYLNRGRLDGIYRGASRF